MKYFRCFIAFALSSFLLQAGAATPAHELRVQCKSEAGSRVGAELKLYVRDCVKAKRAANRPPPTEKQLAHRAKMKTCNEKFTASGASKTERRAFVNACLKG